MALCEPPPSSGASSTPSSSFAVLALAPVAPVRAEALLGGEVQLGGAALAAAYGRGLDAVARLSGVEAQERVAAHGQISPEEVCAMLLGGVSDEDTLSLFEGASAGTAASGGDAPRLCELARGLVLSLSAASQNGDAEATAFLEACFDHGLVPILSGLFITVCAAAEREGAALSASAVAECERAADLMYVALTRPSGDPKAGVSVFFDTKGFVSFAVPVSSDGPRALFFLRLITLPALFVVGMRIFGATRPLADAEASDAGGTAALGLRVLLAVQHAYSALQEYRSTTMRIPGFLNKLMVTVRDPRLGVEMTRVASSPPFLRGLFASLGKSHLGTQVFLIYSNIPPWLDALSNEVDGFTRVLDALSSTAYDDLTLERLIAFISNACGTPDGHGERFAKLFAAKGAFTLLQPTLLSSSASLAVRTAYTIAGIASVKELAGDVERSGVLDLLNDVLRALPLGSVVVESLMSPHMIPATLKLLQPDSPPALQLACLHRVLAAVLVKQMPNLQTYSTPPVISLLRGCATSGDAFIYSAACAILKEMAQPLPFFRHVRGGGEAATIDPSQCAAWGIEQACAWVGLQPFRAYRQIFRDSLVSGRILLVLSDDDLKEMRISHAIHRRAIIFAVNDLREAAGIGASVGGAGALPSATPARSVPSVALLDSRPYDVFISYRRAGGADFAQLLKIQLQAASYTVFLDTDNLGSGKFSDELVTHLRNAQNVVLVWSKGCMERFLDDKDASQVDFVRMEYAQALRLGKHVVPVYKEDFEFPAAERLPDDCRAVLSLNAVKWVAEYREASFKKLAGALLTST